MLPNREDNEGRRTGDSGERASHERRGHGSAAIRPIAIAILYRGIELGSAAIKEPTDGRWSRSRWSNLKEENRDTVRQARRNDLYSLCSRAESDGLVKKFGLTPEQLFHLDEFSRTVQEWNDVRSQVIDLALNKFIYHALVKVSWSAKPKRSSLMLVLTNSHTTIDSR